MVKFYPPHTHNAREHRSLIHISNIYIQLIIMRALIINQNNFRLKQALILISIIDGETGKVVEEYQKDIGDLDPFSLKRLLQNVCNGIVKQYRQDLLIGYTHVHIPPLYEQSVRLPESTSAQAAIARAE